MAVTLHEAIAAARHSCPGDEWVLMSPSEQTRAIYRQMRRLDQAQAAANLQPVPCTARRSDTEIVLCQAAVRTRSSGRCAWKASVSINGLLYCGFHARLEAMQRGRACHAVAAD